MSVEIGFVLLTHNKPHQAVRLVEKLNVMFGYPPIAWHHDFTQCDLPSESITKNISVVRPHFQTSWATFSVVDATLSALQLLFQSNNAPDWFILLSGADYPIKPACTIVQDLSASQFDAHIQYNKIPFDPFYDYRRGRQRGLESIPDRYDDEKRWMDVPGMNVELCRQRYLSPKLRYPFINRRLKPKMRTIRLWNPLFAAPFLPFSKKFSCFAGEHWFCGNRSAAEYLIDFHRTRPALANHYRKLDEYTIVPEESYYQTVLCNAPYLRISQNNWRYVDWSHSERPAHPKTLQMEDLPRLSESPAHFARKFDAEKDSGVLDALDAR